MSLVICFSPIRKSRSDHEIRDGNSYEESIQQVLTKTYNELGPIKYSEIVVAFIFLLTISLWILRKPLSFNGLEYMVSQIFEALPRL